ncbi:unnamed protein product [Diatraea saccharalis]|uniref:Uncharacterized protein n=1 Tax=Diatraea saccharalis TaxID=40085 RepID=A0A9N9WG97_9NEOP|nr:unnamed protein product [Diatraea saccharalis]
MKTTWHLFHSGKREWLLPFERPSPMPPYGLITTTEEPKDFITTLNHYKTTHSEGYFSTFLTYLFYVISEKPDRDVRLLSLAVAKEYAYSYILYKSLPERKSTLAPGITYIIDFINTFFNVKEGLELFKALDNLNKFPNTTANAYEILRTLTKAIFAPYIRFTGTMKSRMLIESINNEIVRANDNEIVERAKSSKENVTNGTDLRRLGFFTNRTRFLVVDRKESDQSEDEENIIRNIQNKLRYTSNFIYEIKDAKKSNANVKLVKSSDETPVFTKRTTEYNPFQKHIARFKIVTRKTDSSKREKILSTTMTKSYKHKLKIKEKHSETFDNYVKFQKIQHDAKLQLGKVTKNYYMDKRIADDRYKQTTLKRKIFGRTIYHKPNVEIIKLSKAPTIDTHNKNRYITKTIGSKTNEAAHVTTKKKTVIPKNKRHKIPLKTFVLVNDFGRNPLKITSLIKNKNVKVYKPHAHGVTESKGDIDEKFKGRNSVLSKITAPTSYSYEEDELKFNINDAFKHNELYYKARQFDLNPERKEGINKLSSYSSEEAAIKSNLYKVIGFNHIVRNATFGHIYSR